MRVGPASRPTAPLSQGPQPTARTAPSPAGASCCGCLRRQPGRFLQNQTYSPRMNQQACALVFTQRSGKRLRTNTARDVWSSFVVAAKTRTRPRCPPVGDRCPPVGDGYTHPAAPGRRNTAQRRKDRRSPVMTSPGGASRACHQGKKPV